MENENENENKNDLKGVQGENEIPLGFAMQQEFCKVNPSYPPRPSQDMPAIVEIAVFIHRQSGGPPKEMFEFDVGERLTVLGEWQKWAYWYQARGNNKSLEYLVKFKLQEIFLEIKNEPKNGTIHKTLGEPRVATTAKSKGSSIADLQSLKRDTDPESFPDSATGGIQDDTGRAEWQAVELVE